MNMKKLRNLLLAGSVAVAAIVGGAVTLNKSRSSSKNIKEMTKQNKPGDVLVEIKTTEGDLTVRLFGDTPRHRDNFVKLAKEGYYNGVLFVDSAFDKAMRANLEQSYKKQAEKRAAEAKESVGKF